jgi:hypothetical protein
MNPLDSTPKHVLRGELLLRGLTLTSFAIKHGLKKEGVLMAFARHCGNPDSVPIGKNTRAILKLLHEEIQTPIDPITNSNSEDAA